MGDLEIPEEFWKAIKMLDEGIEDELPVEILDMEEEMSEGEEKTSLLNEANSILLEICGSGFSIESLPDPLTGTEVLRDKKIFMIDDQEIYFSAFVPSLLAGSEGKAKFVIHKDQTVTELVNAIIESESDVVLLDLNLANGLKGTEVAMC